MRDMQQLLRRRSEAVEPAGPVDTNVAVFVLVAGSVVTLWAINRGFRGFTVNA